MGRGRAAARTPLMTWHEARSLQAKGIEIASHARTHPRLTSQNELAGSFAYMQREPGPGARTFAYPHGRDEYVLSAVERVASALACCSWGGPNEPAIPPIPLRRVEIKGTDSFVDFVVMVSLGRRIRPRKFLKGLIFG